MTQIGIEYMKLKNQAQANAETQRSNLARERISWAQLAEDARAHDLSRQTSLDVAASNRASAYDVANLNSQTTQSENQKRRDFESQQAALDRAQQYSRDAMNAEKGTLVGAYKAGSGAYSGSEPSVAGGVVNVLGYLWESLI